MKPDLTELNEIFSANLPWTPHDFIKEISIEGDRKLYAQQLTSAIDAENDLRFIQKLPGGKNVAVIAEKLPWDTKFFGYGIAKLHGVFPLQAPYYAPNADYTEAFSALLNQAQSQGVQYLFTSVDPRDLAALRALGETGFSLIETRTYYHRNIRDYAYPERFAARAAIPEDVETLAQAAVVMVNAYDRFHADPVIRTEDADRMMYKWVEASILEGFADVTIVPDAPRPSAFCTVKYHKNNWQAWNLKLSQPVFSAVSPEFKGWYKKIISEISYHLRDLGAEHSFMITQATNRAVVWVWESLGYRFGKAELVFRKTLK